MHIFDGWKIIQMIVICICPLYYSSHVVAMSIRNSFILRFPIVIIIIVRLDIVRNIRRINLTKACGSLIFCVVSIRDLTRFSNESILFPLYKIRDQIMVSDNIHSCWGDSTEISPIQFALDSYIHGNNNCENILQAGWKPPPQIFHFFRTFVEFSFEFTRRFVICLLDGAHYEEGGHILVAISAHSDGSSLHYPWTNVKMAE